MRACGWYLTASGILLLKHDTIGQAGYIWSPPGGGIGFGEKAEDVLVREFKEETNLEVVVGNYLFTNEYMDERHHAVELFFKIDAIEGTMRLGNDPEINESEQILKEARFLSFSEVNQLHVNNKHNAFQFVDSAEKIIDLRGFFSYSLI